MTTNWQSNDDSIEMGDLENFDTAKASSCSWMKLTRCSKASIQKAVECAECGCSRWNGSNIE